MTEASRLLFRRSEAAGTESFFFARPGGFDFTAGQYLELTLPGLQGADAVHTFSISSAPADNDLSITTRLRDSAFKQALARMEPGAQISAVEIAGPFGTFCPGRETGRPLVLIAGGIGVTPMRSFIRAEAGRFEDVHLFYANRTPSEAAFLDELGEMAATGGGFNLVATMTGLEAAADWKGERGRIDLAMIGRHVALDAAIFYISGPPAMVSGTRDVLIAEGTQRQRVKVERFDGY